MNVYTMFSSFLSITQRQSTGLFLLPPFFYIYFLPFILPLPVDAGTYITVTLLLIITVILYLDFMGVHFQPLGGGGGMPFHICI